MSCGYSKEQLALYIESDVAERQAIDTVESHLRACSGCRKFCEELRKTQSMIKSGFTTPDAAIVGDQRLRNIRSSVMSRIEFAQESMGWTWKLERLLAAPLRRQRYAIAGLAFVMAACLPIVAQMRASIAEDALLRRPDYREWVFVGAPASPHAHDAAAYARQSVYMNPAAFREYSRSGRFPEGAAMAIETSSPDGVVGLAVSVKDAAYDGGWRYYEFSEGLGRLKSEAAPVAQSAACIGCHAENGATDHVFTQLYPRLKGL